MATKNRKTKDSNKPKPKMKGGSKTKSKATPKIKAKAKTVPTKKAKPVTTLTARSGVRLSARLTPLEDRVIVRVEAAEEKTAGGLYVPQSATERPNRGEVVAAGPGRRNKKGQLRPLDVSVGDCVLFPEYAGTKITMDSQEFLILREDEVLGIVT